jgi:hypothetical protein
MVKEPNEKEKKFFSSGTTEISIQKKIFSTRIALSPPFIPNIIPFTTKNYFFILVFWLMEI